MAIASVPPMMVTEQTTTVVMTATVRKVTVTMTTRATVRMMTTATTARKITVMAATHPMVETRSMEVKAVGEVTTGVPRRVGEEEVTNGVPRRVGEEEVTNGVPSGVPRRVGVVTVGKVVRNAVRQSILDALVAIPTSETRCC